MTEPLLHHRKHILVAPAFGVEDPVRSEPRQGKAGGEQVSAAERPEHRSAGFSPGPASGYSGDEERGGGIVAKSGPGAGDLMQSRRGESASGKPPVDCLHSERQALARLSRAGRFDRPHLCPKGRKALGTGGRQGRHGDSKTHLFLICSCSSNRVKAAGSMRDGGSPDAQSG